MRTKLLSLIVLFACTGLLNAQTVFRGVVIDAETQQPIPNTKIGITNQGVGVVTDNAGKYSYKKYQETLSMEDKLVISASGYENIELSAQEARKLFNRNSTIKMTASSKTRSKNDVKSVKVFWDISEGMQDRDLGKELSTLGAYLDKLGAVSVTLEVFNNRIIATEKWKKWDGDMERFRESVTQTTYNAPSNYSVLDFDKADAFVLVSNGDPNYGKLNVAQDTPVYTISTTPTELGTAYLNTLIKYTSGRALRSSEGANKQLDYNPENPIKEKTAATLTGVVTSLGKPLQGATITIKGDFAEFTTAADGSFKIPANVGDVLLVRALGMFPKGVAVVNDEPLTIKMLPSSDQLDAVVLSAKERVLTGSKVVEGTNEPNMPGGVTSLGDFYITNKDIVPTGQSIAEVLRSKFQGVWIRYGPEGEVVTIFGKTPLWYVNGFRVGPGEPLPLYIPDNEILSVIVKDDRPISNLKYGGDGETGLQVLITTKNFREDFKKPSLLAKNNDYTEEVPSINVKKNIITGTVTSIKGPIQGAEVLIKGSFESTLTEADGSFSLKAKNGDVLIISALGMFTKETAVLDSKEYTLELIPSGDVLDEVEITGQQRQLEKTKAQEVFGYGPDLETGRYKLKGFGSFNVTIITNEDFKFETQPDMGQALFGRFESVFVYTDPTRQDTDPNLDPTLQRFGRPYILRGNVQEPIQLYVDGQLELGTVYQINPSEVVSISIKSDAVGIFPPALLIDTNRSSISQKAASLLAKDNDYKEEVSDISKTSTIITGTITSPSNGKAALGMISLR